MDARHGRPSEQPQPAEYASVEEPSPRPGTTTPSKKRSPSARWKNSRPCPTSSPPCCPPRTAPAPLTHRIDPVFRLPPTDLLNEAPGRNPYDEQELKDTASRIKAKFEEFNVLGNVVQINPGPVVTTFEFKPEAGIKYSRITNLTRRPLPRPAGRIDPDRAHPRQAHRRHRGAEHPSAKLIALRQMLESDEFQGSHSHLTIPLGKDINGRIRVAALETMPHLLIAGSTGIGQERHDQLHDHVDPVQGHAR